MSKEEREREKRLKELTAKALRKLTASDVQKEVYSTDQVKKENESVIKHRNTKK